MEYYNEAERERDYKEALVEDVKENLKANGQDMDSAKSKAKEVKQVNAEEREKKKNKINIATIIRVIIEDAVWCVVACVEVFFCIIRYIYAGNIAGIVSSSNFLLAALFIILDVLLFYGNRSLERKIKKERDEREAKANEKEEA